MLRECARYEALAKIMLHSDEFFNFFRYVEVSTFDIASDAFSTFKVNAESDNRKFENDSSSSTNGAQWLYNLQELLTRHKMLCAEFLEANYEQVFTHYQQLLNSENYVTRRQSLKLLGELLLDRHNFTVNPHYHRLPEILSAWQLIVSFHLLLITQVMTKYISNPENLKLMMNMLKEKSRNIQFEAFHVFKV